MLNGSFAVTFSSPVRLPWLWAERAGGATDGSCGAGELETPGFCPSPNPDGSRGAVPEPMPVPPFQWGSPEPLFGSECDRPAEVPDEVPPPLPLPPPLPPACPCECVGCGRGEPLTVGVGLGFGFATTRTATERGPACFLSACATAWTLNVVPGLVDFGTVTIVTKLSFGLDTKPRLQVTECETAGVNVPEAQPLGIEAFPDSVTVRVAAFAFAGP